MPGTREGGLAAAATNKARYDETFKARGGFYGAIGSLGGETSSNSTWANSPEGHKKLSEAGRLGGSTPRSGVVGTVPCQFCERLFKTRQSAKRHAVNIHGEGL